MRVRSVFAAIAFLGLAALPGVVAPAAQAAELVPSFSFGAAGDMGANSDASATLTTLAGAGTNFFLHLGDTTYGQLSESDWCTFVTNRVGTSYPYEVVAGGHEANTPDADITKVAACLPNKAGPLTGTYGKRYFFDYPPSPQAPLARVIMITPGLKLPEGTQSYVKGTANYAFVQSTIQGARAAGIPWVIVGMAFDCITAGEKSCEISADLYNLLVAEKVDLILQGHEHGYERSKQLALSSACPAVPVGSFNAACVVDNGADNTYTKGAGPVTVIAGTAGIGLRAMNTSDPEAPYFAKLMGKNISPAMGFVKYTVTATGITAQFVRSTGSFSDSFTIGSPGPLPPVITGMARTAHAGYWLAATDGRVFPFGDAARLGSLTTPPNPPIIAIAARPDGTGYWLVNQKGAVFPFGTAASLGSTASLTLNQPIVGMASTPSGNGYWLVASDGGIFAFGDARFFGSTGSLTLNQPIVGMASTPSGNGYWLVASDGGIFAFGDARFFGSTGNIRLNQPIVAMASTGTGGGYWFVASDGGIFAFGDARFFGSLGGMPPSSPVVDMAATPTGGGYWLAVSDGRVFGFGDATPLAPGP